MADRLSESIGQHLVDETGLGYQRGIMAGFPASPCLLRLDLQKIMEQDHPGRLIRSLPVQPLYHALRERGLGDCVEILPLLSQEQFVRICDYDVWDGERLAPKQLLSWLSLYRESSAGEMFRRFSRLDEEYQLACLAPFISVFTEEDYERMTDDQQDSLQRFPGNALYFSVRAEDPVLHRQICELMDAAMSEDMSYAMQLVSHAGYAVPNEHEHLLTQFRKARIEEDGFVSYEESLSFFRPVRPSPLISASQNLSISGNLQPQPAASSGRSFLERVLEASAAVLDGRELTSIQAGLLCLANGLCSAVKMEPGDLPGLRDTFAHAQALISLSLELQSDASPEKAVSLLRFVHPKELFQTGLGYVHDLRLRVVSALDRAGLKEATKLKGYAQHMKPGLVAAFFDHLSEDMISLEQAEIMKGLFNRFPLCPLESSSDQKENSPARLSFHPISSLKDLQQLLLHLEAFFCQLALLRSGADKSLWGEKKGLSLEQALARGLVRGILGQRFQTEDLNLAEVEQFAAATDEQLHAGSNAFLEAAKQMLKSSKSLLSQEHGEEEDSIRNAMSGDAYSEYGLDQIRRLAKRLIMARREPSSLLWAYASTGSALNETSC